MGRREGGEKQGVFGRRPMVNSFSDCVYTMHVCPSSKTRMWSSYIFGSRL